ncbi:hypothetical protein [Sphingomonas sp. 22R3R2A-7]|jgi:hypothetical protein|uniref:hypothetical protein n=1 Tax=Sphingomonas sp. 22R3R2A-7 TaxID=3050230 RepID=UPI002FE346E5
MNLLLLLSALLSALTGVVPGVRGQAAQAVAQGAVSPQAVAVAVVRRATRPVAGPPSLQAVAASPALPAIAVDMSSLWADRRRE